MINPEDMRRRFHELGRTRDEAAAKAAPIRARYEALLTQVGQLQLQMRPILDELQAIEAPLFEIDSERAAIVRYLKGNTGEPG